MISPATSRHFTPTCKYCECILWECCPATKPCPFYGIEFCISCFFEHEYPGEASQ